MKEKNCCDKKEERISEKAQKSQKAQKNRKSESFNDCDKKSEDKMH